MSYNAAKEKEKAYHFVIVDARVIVGTEGRKRLQELMASDPDVKFIVSCGYSVDPRLCDFEGCGSVRKLVKPYKIEDLKRVLNHTSVDMGRF